MNPTQQETVQSALNQIEAMIRDLNWGIPNGYVMGYELGYMKGVLEHLLRTYPDIQTRGAYLNGYINGYSQGLLYLVRSNGITRPPDIRRGISRRSLGMIQREENQVRGGTVVSQDDTNMDKASCEDLITEPYDQQSNSTQQNEYQ